jgi:dCMP deaminase
MPSQEKWDSMFLQMALVVSSMSKDPSTKVGAVIVTPNNKHISIGYNGFVKGIEETAAKWSRPIKYQYVRHAEDNAIINCPFDTTGCTIYCTHQPCHRCLEMIAQAEIKRVIYLNSYPNLEYPEIWAEHAKLFKEIKQVTI